MLPSKVGCNHREGKNFYSKAPGQGAYQNLSRLSHGVAIDDGPRREPWVLQGNPGKILLRVYRLSLKFSYAHDGHFNLAART